MATDNRKWQEIFEEARGKWVKAKKEIETSKALTPHGKAEKLAEVDIEFVEVWRELDKRYSEELFKVGEEIRALVDCPIPKPTPSPDLIAQITFEAERLIGALTAARSDGFFELLSRIGAGNEAQRRAFTAFFARFIEAAERIFPEGQERATALSQLRGLYQRIESDPNLLSAEEKEYQKKFDSAMARQEQLSTALTMARRAWESTRVNMSGQPDPWAAAEIMATQKNPATPWG